MTVNTCPECKQSSFTWSMEKQELSSYKVWECSFCNYRAMEDEWLESKCLDCDGQPAAYLSDDDRNFIYCWSCQVVHKLNMVEFSEMN